MQGRGRVVSRDEIQGLVRASRELRGIGDRLVNRVVDLAEHRAIGEPEPVRTGIVLDQIKGIARALQALHRPVGKSRNLRRCPRQQHRNRRRHAARGFPKRVATEHEIKGVAGRREMSGLAGQIHELQRARRGSVREVELPWSGRVRRVVRHQVKAVADHREIDERFRQRALRRGRRLEEQLHALNGFGGVEERQISREVKLGHRNPLVRGVLVSGRGHFDPHIAGIETLIEKPQRCGAPLLEELHLDGMHARRQRHRSGGLLAVTVQSVVVHHDVAVDRQPAAVIRTDRERVSPRVRDVQETIERQRIIGGTLAHRQVGRGGEASLFGRARLRKGIIQRAGIIHHRVGVGHRLPEATEETEIHKLPVVARHCLRHAIKFKITVGKAVRRTHIQRVAVRQQSERPGRPGDDADIRRPNGLGLAQHGEGREPDVLAGLAVAERREAIPALALARSQHIAVVVRETIPIQIGIEETGGPAGPDVHEEIAAAADGAVGQDRIRLRQIEQEVAPEDDMEAARIDLRHPAGKAIGGRCAQDQIGDVIRVQIQPRGVGQRAQLVRFASAFDHEVRLRQRQ